VRQLLNNQQVRNTTLQVLFVSTIAILFVTFVVTAKTNLDAQGITSGFGFFERATAWDVNFSLIDFKSSDTYLRVLIVGFLNSVFVGAIALSLATLAGVTVGAMRTSSNAMARIVGTYYVELFRNVPLILQLLFWYALLIELPHPRNATIFLGGNLQISGRGIYFTGLNVTGLSAFLAIIAFIASVIAIAWIAKAHRFQRTEPAQRRRLQLIVAVCTAIFILVIMYVGRIPETELLNVPALKGLNIRGGIRATPELLACIVAIAVYGTAYIAEIMRAGFNSVPKGQVEAGDALGLHGAQIFWRIRLPLAVRAVMPTLINQYIWLFKATTIGIAVGFADYFFVISTSINQSGQTLELIALLMLGFLSVNYTIAWVLNRVNDAIKLRGTQNR